MDKECTKCHKIKPIADFVTANRNKSGKGSMCTDCNKKKHKIYYKQNKEKWYPFKLKQRYGLTKEGYLDLYNSQDGKCAICSKEMKPFNQFTHVDHNHETGKVRGILCHQCNIKLTHVEDIVFREKAIIYLKKAA